MKRKNVDHVMVASLCRANPGAWQEVGEYSSGESAASIVRAIQQGRGLRVFVAYSPAGAFEARRELTDNGARVEARFVGEPITDVESAVDLLGALPMPAGPELAPEKSSRRPVAEATPTEFFRSGRLYTRDLPFRAPEDCPNFECVGVASHPSKENALRAFGFEQPGAGQPWASIAQRSEEWDEGWIDLGPIKPDRLTRTLAPTQALREENQGEAPALVIYRAQWDTAPLGRYTTEAEARKHCEIHARRDLPTATFDWIADEEDGVAELVAELDGEENPTGYVVTALEIASKYDPEADE
ncbi:hypothetical protein [Streptomyces sp. NPDC057253]|uniref:hypothetical protein n=1 Tax=Streptomyces sp. NPDC057253 TaxID=3346069 RepID=UPI00363881C3